MNDKINQKKNKNNTFLSIFLITFKHPPFFFKNFVYSCFLATFAILYRGM